MERSSNNGDIYVELTTLEMDIEEFLDENLAPGTYIYRIQSTNENGESDFVSTDMAREVVLAVGDFPEKKLSIYPNPAPGGFVYVKLLDNYMSYNVAISDIQGKILNLPIEIYDGFWRINTSSVPSGIYIVKLEKEGNIVSRKIIID